ncbi:MAG: hypothetical protein ACRD0F_00825 [Acidimicrobiales bacterium]
MPMREDCKNFQSRTYATAEVARWCVLDLAPEAPWRCPANCAAFERRMVDIAFKRGTLMAPPPPDEPPGLDEHDDAATLLEEAEDILNAVGAEVLADVERERRKGSGGGALGKLGDRLGRLGGKKGGRKRRRR